MFRLGQPIDGHQMHLENISGLHGKGSSNLHETMSSSTVGESFRVDRFSGWGSVTFNSRWPSGGVTPTYMVSMLNMVQRELLRPVIGNVLECVGLLSKTIGAGILAVEMY